MKCVLIKNAFTEHKMCIHCIYLKLTCTFFVQKFHHKSMNVQDRIPDGGGSAAQKGQHISLWGCFFYAFHSCVSCGDQLELKLGYDK